MAATASIEKKNIPLVSSMDQQAAAQAAKAIEQSLYEKVAVLQDLSAQSKSLTDKMANLMDDTSDSAKYSAEIVDNMDYLIEDLKALNDSLDVYYPDLQTALDDSQELVRRTTDALNNGISTLTIIQNTLKDSSDDFDAAARDSLRGSMELLDKSLNILDSTTVMRQAGRTMKDTIDNELDKFDTDNRFLFMDPSADKVSFTSDRNKPPKTLQIVMRTDEISVDDDTAKTADAEVAKAKESPLRRMWNVLVQMWKAPDLQTALDDSQELVRRTTDALNNGISTLTIIQNTLKDSSDDFDAAARDSLRGSMELLDKSLNILDSTTVMRQAGRTMKDTIDNELDKFDTDNRFLFMDPSADKVSFTSDRNKPPKTLQIVMRTDEISVDDDTAKTADAEVAKAKESPLRRMWNVLVQMWKAMVSIFKNR